MHDELVRYQGVCKKVKPYARTPAGPQSSIFGPIIRLGLRSARNRAALGLWLMRPEPPVYEQSHKHGHAL